MPIAGYNVRILAVFLGFIGLFGAIGRWVYHLQIERHEELAGKARCVYTSSYTRTGRRGQIFDVGGNLLAGLENCVDVMFEPRKIPPQDLDATIIKLAGIFDVDEDLLRKRCSSRRVEVVIKKGVPLKRAQTATGSDIKGLRIMDSQRRIYPKGQLAACVLGFTTAGKGAYGIDKVCDEALTPRKGVVKFERDRKGRMHYESEKTVQTALDGHDVYLTISEPLQGVAETELAALCAEHQPRYAYAIMANPHTGAIMALAQYPTFDPNDRSHMDPELWRNHAVSDVFHPGSTMKTVAVSGALDHGVVDLNTVFYCEKGLWMYGGRPLRDSHGSEDLAVWEIIRDSSNIGTAKICLSLGKKRLWRTMRLFGMGEKTGIELPYESRGLFPALRRWDKLSITRFPIGQGMAATPLQMVQAYCALANQGSVMQLHLIDRIIDPNTGDIVLKKEPIFKRQAAKPEAIYDMVQAMKTVVTDKGTARKAKVPGYSVAGKTGTSQKLVNGTYEGHKKYVSSFIGFVPADNPAFVLLVVADEPSGKSYYGGTVCGPTFSRISQQALRYLNVTEDTVSN